MSFLQLKELPEMKSAVISFWVKVGELPKADQLKDPWKVEWMPPEINRMEDKKGVAYLGSSYYMAFPQFNQPVLKCWPPGDAFSRDQAASLGTFKDGVVPFITFGDPNLSYNRIKWVIKDIGKKWEMLPGPGMIGIHKVYATQPEGMQAGTPPAAGAPPTPGAPPPAAPPPPPPIVGGGGSSGGGGASGGWRAAREAGGGAEGGGGGGGAAPVGDAPAGGGGGAVAEPIVPPSFIGLCNNRLRIHLQTAGRADYTGYAFAQTKIEDVHIMTPLGGVTARYGAPVTGWKDFSEDHAMFLGASIFYDDVSKQECTQHPEAFIMEPDVGVNDGKWHHIALSFELSGTVASEGTGTTKIKPHPGPVGQFNENEEFAIYGGAPNENCGDNPACESGTMTSSCKAWLMIDGKPYDGKNLHMEEAWRGLERRKGYVLKGTHSSSQLYAAEDIWHVDPSEKENGKDILEKLEKNSIFPPNAFLAPCNDPRLDFITSRTEWERFYRTILGAYTGPPCKIVEGNESTRRFSYPLPKYQFQVEGIPPGPLGIPAGPGWAERNANIMMADLQIWVGKSHDVSSDPSMFIDKDGKPAGLKKLRDALGKPDVCLHRSSNWIRGYNTGSLGVSGEGDQRTKNEGGQFEVTGKIDRYLPDPKLEPGDTGPQPPKPDAPPAAPPPAPTPAPAPA